MVKIPVEKIPNQQISVVLGGQNCTIHLYQRDRFMFMDLTVDGETVRSGAICLTDELATGFSLNKFSGKIFFTDLLGEGGIPNWEELDSRFVLCYEE